METTTGKRILPNKNHNSSKFPLRVGRVVYSLSSGLYFAIERTRLIRH